MGRTLGDLDQYLDPGLTLTMRGVEYTVPLPSAELGLWCRRMSDASVDATSTDAEVKAAAESAAELPDLPGRMTFEERLLGDAYPLMVADEQPDAFVQFAAQTVYVWIIAGEDMAARFWQAGGRPEAAGPDNRAARRASSRKTSTGAVSATRSRASTSGTSSPTKSSRNGAAAASRGRRS
jgi:hypothetical protein